MRRRYRINKHSSRTGVACFQGPDLRPEGSRAWARLVLAGHVEGWHWGCLVFIVGAPIWP
jgi:hypothetical protein